LSSDISKKDIYCPKQAKTAENKILPARIYIKSLPFLAAPGSPKKNINSTTIIHLV